MHVLVSVANSCPPQAHARWHRYTTASFLISAMLGLHHTDHPISHWDLLLHADIAPPEQQGQDGLCAVQTPARGWLQISTEGTLLNLL